MPRKYIIQHVFHRNNFPFYLHFDLQDLLNFDDPLNVEAAEHYERDKVQILSFFLIYV